MIRELPGITIIRYRYYHPLIGSCVLGLYRSPEYFAEANYRPTLAPVDIASKSTNVNLPDWVVMHSFIPPNQFVAIKLPSDQTRIVKLVPDS